MSRAFVQWLWMRRWGLKVIFDLNERVLTATIYVYYSISWRIQSHNVCNMPIMKQITISLAMWTLLEHNARTHLQILRRTKHNPLPTQAPRLVSQAKQFILLRYTHKVVASFVCCLLLFLFLFQKINWQPSESNGEQKDEPKGNTERRVRLTISDNYSIILK